MIIVGFSLEKASVYGYMSRFNEKQKNLSGKLFTNKKYLCCDASLQVIIEIPLV